MQPDTFLHVLEAETNRLQELHGSMSRVYYHQHYLAQEAIRKLDTYRTVRRWHQQIALRDLVGAVASMMGQYNKVVGYEGEEDFNYDFVHFLKEEARLCKKNRVVANISDAIGQLVDYNELAATDKHKAVICLIKASVAVVNEWERVGV
jgi:hypothetical protein